MPLRFAKTVVRNGCEIEEDDDKRIDDDVYDLLRTMPKVDLHEHQSGSSDLAFLKYVLIKLKQEGKPNGIGSLDFEEVRRHYRAYITTERGKAFSGGGAPGTDNELTEMTPETIEEFRQVGLDALRSTSGRINPHVKNLPAAYLLAHLFALEVASENVRYVEYRVSPSGNAYGGYGDATVEDIIGAVDDGLEDAQSRLARSRKKLDYGLILLMERQAKGDNDKVATAVHLAEEAVRLRGKYDIVGVDLAGDELNNPVTDFKPAFDIIKAHNDKAVQAGHPEKRIGITIHAGETPRSGDLAGWQSIQEAIDAAWSPNTPVRIGHGIQLINSSPALKRAFRDFVSNPGMLLGDTAAIRNRLMQSSPLLKEIIEKNIVLEMCPKSNVMTYGVDPFLDGSLTKLNVRNDPQHDDESYSAQSYKRHPAVFLSRLGVNVTLSSDNRTISNSDITNEFVKLYKYMGIRYKDAKHMMRDGLSGAFIFDPRTRKTVANDMAKGFKAIERDPKHLVAMYKMENGGKQPHPFKMLLMTVWIHLRQIANALRQFFSEWKKTKPKDRAGQSVSR